MGGEVDALLMLRGSRTIFLVKCVGWVARSSMLTFSFGSGRQAALS